jgi:hypothetical protein
MTPRGEVPKPRAMVAYEASKLIEPRTLAEANEVLADVRPPRTAPLSEWLAYHQRAAAWYAEVAEIDRGHHHESLFMAEQAHQRVKEIKAQMALQLPAGEKCGGGGG